MVVRKIAVMTLGILMAAALFGCAAAQDTIPEEGATGPISLAPAAQNNDLAQEAADLSDGDMEYLFLEDRIVGIYESNPEVRQQFVGIVNELLAAIPDELYKHVIIIPSRIEFEDEELKQYADPQQDDIKRAYMEIDQTATKVDAYYAISQHLENVDDFFFRTDHHWTQLGAYYVAQALFEAIGIEYHDLQEYDVHRDDDFLGYLYATYNEISLKDHPDKLVYYTLPGVERMGTVYSVTELGAEPVVVEEKLVDPDRSGYQIFVAGGEYAYWTHAIIEGTEDSDRAIMVVGESTMMAMSPWLADTFNRVILVDPRYYSDGNAGVRALISEYGITDFLLLNSTGSLSATSYFNARMEMLAK